MQHADGSDAELLERAVVADAPGPTGAVVDTFAGAMRERSDPQFTLRASGDEVPAGPVNLVARPFAEELDEAPPAEQLDDNLDPPPFEFPDEAP